MVIILGKSVLNTDSFDRRRFKQILGMSQNLLDMSEKGKEIFPFFQPLMADMWASLYKMKPQLIEEEEVKSELQINHSFMKKIMNDESFRNFRETTKLDDLMSAIGTIRYSEKVHEWIEVEKQKNEELQEALEEALKQQRKIKHIQQEYQKAQEKLEQAREQKDKAKQDSVQSKLEKAGINEQQAHQAYQKAFHAAHEQVQQAMNGDGQSFSKAMAEAQQETNLQKEALVSLLTSEAGNGEAELKKIPLRGQIALAEKLSKDNKLKRIAEWAGRFKAIAHKKQKNKHTTTIDRSGVNVGPEIERLLPSELAAYSNSSTKLDFLRRFAENQTMVYAPEGKETLGKGPIICCLDQSASMEHLDNLAKGFVLAIMMIAKRQKRDFGLVLFSESVKTKIYIKGKISPLELVDFAQIFLDGGTRFDLPLEKTLEMIQKSSLKKADVIFVTDGEASLSKQFVNNFNKKKKEKQFNVLSLVLGQEDTTTIKNFSEKIIRASSFEDEVAEEVFSI